MTYSTLTHLECPECGQHYDADRLQTFCHECNSPLLAAYDLKAAAAQLSKAEIAHRPKGMWRWHELLPVRQPEHMITLGEGDAPLLAANRLGEVAGFRNLTIKDESGQPTGSFKARGLAMAVARGVELGVSEFVIPTAGNAGGALSAYAARAGVKAHVFMPEDAPAINKAEVAATGGDLRLVKGIISDAGKAAAALAKENDWFDVSTLKEPYRLEGKKTMGLELAEDFDWELPDVIFYPTGGGTGLVGMWKAFEELGAMGWLGEKRPKMVAVQTTGCAPIVRAFEAGKQEAQFWQGASTVAAGLRVPHAFGHKLILDILYKSKGCAVAVSDQALLEAQSLIAQTEGLFAAPEGAATLAGAIKLLEVGWLDPSARIVLYNTGTGLKYVN